MSTRDQSNFKGHFSADPFAASHQAYADLMGQQGIGSGWLPPNTDKKEKIVQNNLLLLLEDV